MYFNNTKIYAVESTQKRTNDTVNWLKEVLHSAAVGISTIRFNSHKPFVLKVIDKATIMVIIFWDFLILYQIFDLLQVKRNLFIRIASRHAKRRTTWDPRELENFQKISKMVRIIAYPLDKITFRGRPEDVPKRCPPYGPLFNTMGRHLPTS